MRWKNFDFPRHIRTSTNQLTTIIIDFRDAIAFEKMFKITFAISMEN